MTMTPATIAALDSLTDPVSVALAEADGLADRLSTRLAKLSYDCDAGKVNLANDNPFDDLFYDANDLHGVIQEIHDHLDRAARDAS